MTTANNLQQDIQLAINHHSGENGSNAPDFILAQYLQGCLDTFNAAVRQREHWYGRDSSSFRDAKATGSPDCKAVEE